MLRSSVWAPEQSFVLVPNNGGISPSYMVSVELVHPKMLTPQKLSSHSPAVNVKLWTNKELYPRRWFCWYSSLIEAQFTLIIARSTFRYFWEEVLPMMVSPRGFQSINFSLWARALPGWLTGPGTQCKNLQEICFQVTSYLLSPTSAAPSGGYKLVIYFPRFFDPVSVQPTVTFGKREECQNRESFERKAAARSSSRHTSKQTPWREFSIIVIVRVCAVGCGFYRFDLKRVSNLCRLPYRSNGGEGLVVDFSGRYEYGMVYHLFRCNNLYVLNFLYGFFNSEQGIFETLFRIKYLTIVAPTRPSNFPRIPRKF